MIWPFGFFVDFFRVVLSCRFWSGPDPAGAPRVIEPRGDVEVPHAPFRPIRRSSMSGKRTRRSQKLHNRSIP